MQFKSSICDGNKLLIEAELIRLFRYILLGSVADPAAG